MSTDATRESLLLRVKNPADQQAWAEFDAIYRPMLSRFARARGLDDADAEDVVQHCMAAVSRHIGSFEYDPSKGAFKGWLRTLVNNRCRNLLRDRRDKQAGSADLHDLADPDPSPESLFDRIWLQSHLRHALELVRAEVEPTTYQAYLRHVIQEQTVDQVCRELDVTPERLYAIKWRLTRKLADKMKELLPDEDGLS